MKLIIDIEKDYYEMLKYNVEHGQKYKPFEIIANGTPYNPSGDCISREALRKAFEAVYPLATNEMGGVVNKRIYDIIDNAQAVPQVTVFTETADETAVADLKAELQNVIETRPQGEWYYGEDECGQDGWFCSECNFFVPWYYQYYEKDINFIREYKACPHCLAEMVTYTGKDREEKGGAE